MKCIHCGRGIADGVALHRQNPTGETGVWACDEHNAKPADPLVREIVDAVQGTAPNLYPSEAARVHAAYSEDVAARVCRDVAELPDRSSPEDWPEAMLVTAGELRRIVVAALADGVKEVKRG